MDQAHGLLRSNLRIHAQPARERLALTQAAVCKLTALPLQELIAIERGDDANLKLDELINLANFLGLTAVGEPRPQIKGSKNTII